MKKILRTAAALALAGCMMTANVFAATAFTDVPSNYWGKTFIDQAADAGLVSGMGDGTYGVNGKLSAAQFTTMVCNLICKDDVTTYSKTYKPAEWWYSYMAVAYNKGFLKNTTVGDARVANNAWSASSVNAEISRYDMAQIMVNVANSQGWSMPSNVEVLAAQLKIGDWNKIPAKYQNAVATAYAKTYLSGMDSAGTFAGDQSMTRTHGAVVICKLLSEHKNAGTAAAPTYTNTTKLVNGKSATQANVMDALDDLKTEYPKNTAWNAIQVYTSKVLGSTFGADAYAYTISDRIFGTFKAAKADVEDMKAGDLLYLNDLKCHVVVTEVDGDDFYYTGCGSTGKIYWNGSGEISDLGSKDVLYTRYDAEDASDTLSDGKKATESNVKALIDAFLADKYEYDVGDEWDMSYKSEAFGHRNKKSGSEAFACYLSDYVFGDLEVEDVDDFDDLRASDVIELYDEEEWVIVTKVSGDTVYYLGVDSDDEVYEDTLDLDYLNGEDYGYTRYPVEDKDNQDEDELENGKAATESNVKALIDKFLNEEYDVGDEWDDTYVSNVFTSRKVSGGRAFAYYLSDYIFGELEEAEVEDFDDLRAGDLLILDDSDEYEYVTVTKVSGDTIYYLGIDAWDEVYEDDLDVDTLDSDADWAYTRYPDSGDSDDDINEDDVADLITQFHSRRYDIGETWDMEQSYTSDVFSNRSVTGSRAFAYYFSDYLFGDLSVQAYDGDEVGITDIRLGDVVMIEGGDNGDTYIVVTDVDNSTGEFTYVYANSRGKIRSSSMEASELVFADTLYTRYPD